MIRRPRQRAPQDRYGWPVYFADSGIDVHLTGPDYKGTPGTHDDCAIARACIRIYGCIGAEIGRDSSYLEFDKFYIRYHTLGLARLLTVAFDYKALQARGGIVKLGAIPPSGRKPRVAGVIGGSGTGNPATVRIPDPFLRPRLAS